jgi:hypothetical protein
VIPVVMKGTKGVHMEASPLNNINFSMLKASTGASVPILKFYFTHFSRVLMIDVFVLGLFQEFFLAQA